MTNPTNIDELLKRLDELDVENVIVKGSNTYEDEPELEDTEIAYYFRQSAATIRQLRADLATSRANESVAFNRGVEAMREAAHSLSSEDRFFTDGRATWSVFLLDNFQDELGALQIKETKE
jgi:hypothetical protein